MQYATLAINLLLALIDHAGQISALIQKAQGEGRDITPEELQGLLDADSLARAELVRAIAEAKAEGH